MFMFPVVLMLAAKSIFGRSGEVDINLGIVDFDGSALSKADVKVFDGIDAFTVKRGNLESLIKLLREARLNAVLIIPNGIERT